MGLSSEPLKTAQGYLSPLQPVESAMAAVMSVGLLSGPDHRVAGPLVLLAHSGLLRGWLEARVLERRDRWPFKETFLCLRKEKKREQE